MEIGELIFGKCWQFSMITEELVGDLIFANEVFEFSPLELPDGVVLCELVEAMSKNVKYLKKKSGFSDATR